MSKIRPIKPDEITADDWKRTRGAVLNVLIAASFGIAACGVALGRRPIPAPSAATRQMAQQTYAGLIGIALLGYAYRRMFGSASRLREIGGLARFRSARIASAWIATLAVPLGFARILRSADARRLRPLLGRDLGAWRIGRPQKRRPRRDFSFRLQESADSKIVGFPLRNLLFRMDLLNLDCLNFELFDD